MKIFDEHGREVGKDTPSMISDAYFAWEYVGFIKTVVEGSGWQSKKDNDRFIAWTDSHENYNEGPLFPQGPLFLRKQDHQGFCDLFVSQIHDGEMRVKFKIPKEHTIYPIT